MGKQREGGADYLEEFLRQSPAFYALLRAIECRYMSKVIIDPPVLDLGCGDGMFGSVLFNNQPGAIDFGIDLSTKDIAKAELKKVYKSLQLGDIQCLPFADSSIGSIFSNSVFEHLEDIDLALCEAARVLRPGGKLVLTSPNNRLVDKFLSARLLHSIGLSGAARAAGNLGNRTLGNRTCLSTEQWKQKATHAGFSSTECIYMIPPKVFHVSEVLMPFGIPSILAKRLLGRLLFAERRISLQLFHWLLMGYYEHAENSDGLATIVISEK